MLAVVDLYFIGVNQYGGRCNISGGKRVWWRYNICGSKPLWGQMQYSLGVNTCSVTIKKNEKIRRKTRKIG